MGRLEYRTRSKMAMGVFSSPKPGDFLLEICGRECVVLYLWNRRAFWRMFN